MLTYFTCKDPETSWLLQLGEDGRREQEESQRAADVQERLFGRCELCQENVGQLSIDGGIALCDDCVRMT